MPTSSPQPYPLPYVPPPQVTGLGDGFSTVAPFVSTDGDFSSNTSFAVAGEVVLFADATGKLGKRSTGSGLATLVGGVLGLVTDNSGNWNTAYDERAQWDGGATNLVATTGRVSLGLVIGTNVQAYSANLTAWAATTPSAFQPLDSDLTTIAGLVPASGTFIVGSAAGGGTWVLQSTGTAKLTLGINNVTNDAQTKAVVMPNTLPAAGQLPVGNAGGTAYAPVTLSGSGFTASLSSAGVLNITNFPWGNVAGTPTTLAGYGISDAQPLDADLTAIAALTTTAFGRGFLPLADAAAGRTYIGAGTSNFNGTWGALTGTPTTLAGYGITDAQPLDADLTVWAGLTPSANFQVMVPHTFAQMRSDLGLGSASLANVGDFEVPLTVANSVARSGNTLSLVNDLTSPTGPQAGVPAVVYGINAGSVHGYFTVNPGNWDTAFTDRMKWDGGSSGLVAPTGRASLGLVIGTTVQAWDTDLDLISSTSPGNSFYFGTNASGVKGFYVLPGGTGTVTNIATSGPITGGPITNTGTIGFNSGADLALSVPQSMTANDAATGATNALLVGHEIAGTPVANFGTNILMRAKSDTVSQRTIGQLSWLWTDPVDATRTSKLILRPVSSGTVKDTLTLWASGGISVNNAVDPTAGFVNVPSAGGYKKNNLPLASDDLAATATNNNAPAGGVGETVASYLATAAAVVYTTAQQKNLTSISLTAGDWDVRGCVTFILNGVPAATAYNGIANIGTTTGVVTDDGAQSSFTATSLPATTLITSSSCPLSPKRISLASTTTVFLVGKAPTFTGGAVSAYGYIEARRRR